MKPTIDNFAAMLAKTAHDGQVDKGGVDYFCGHLTTVAENVDTNNAKAVAYLHDFLEDTDFDPTVLEYILVKFFGKDGLVVFDAVVAITKVDGEPYKQYLDRVNANDLAKQVKLADLANNMDTTRLPNIDDETLTRIEKYKNAVKFLENV